MADRAVIAGAEMIGRAAFHAAAEAPFAFKSVTFAAARSALMAAISSGASPIVIIGFPGIGKTTLLRTLSAELEAEGRPVVLWDAADTARHFPVTPAQIRERKDSRARESAQRALVFIDDAHDLSDATLKTLADDEGVGCDGVVFAGTPPLTGRLRVTRLGSVQPHLVQLQPLASDEVPLYVRYRLRVAGVERQNLFSAAAMDAIALLSRGVPGEINRLCATALLLAEIDGSPIVDAESVYEAAADSGCFAAHAVPSETRAGGPPAVMSGTAATPAPTSKAREVSRLTAAAPGTDTAKQRRHSRRVATAGMLGCVAAAGIAAVYLPPLLDSLPLRDVAISTASVAPPAQQASAQPVPAVQPVPTVPAAQPAPTLPAPQPVPIVPAAEPASSAHTDTAQLQPAEPATGPATEDETRPIYAQVSPGAVEALQRGEQLLAERDYVSARLMLRYAADRGSAAAALSLARTYDPSLSSGAVGIRVDPEQAKHWYMVAAGRGNDAAREHLADLGGVVDESLLSSAGAVSEE